LVKFYGIVFPFSILIFKVFLNLNPPSTILIDFLCEPYLCKL